MPWRGPEVPGEFPTLGFLVADYIEAKCVIPDGEFAGDPFLLTDEMLQFLLHYYRLRPDARADRTKPSRAFVHDRGGQLVRPQKWGKGPLGAAIICAESDPEGPVLFDGWDANGEPVGRPWATPWVQVTACSEDQTDNVWRALVPMIELGELKADIPDTGETRINLPTGGKIEPVTSAARSRLGQRITFALQDEAHSWLKQNGGRKLADTQRRNLAGMGGRWLETGNAWDPAEESVAQQTHESRAPGVYKDLREGPRGRFTVARTRRRILKTVYGDSWWVDLDRIDAECVELLPRDPAQAERFFGNRIVVGEDQAFDPERWKQLARPELTIAEKRLVSVGFDGARYEDASGFVVTDIETGLQVVAGVWECPESARGEWEVPEEEVDATLEELFDTFNVWRVYADPPYWELSLDRWAGKYDEKRIIRWYTHRKRQMAFSLRAYKTAMQSNRDPLTHDGHEGLARHIANARKEYHPGIKDDDGRPLWTIRKDRPGSPRKIDLAMAGCLSWQARGDAIASGALKKKRRRHGGL